MGDALAPLAGKGGQSPLSPQKGKIGRAWAATLLIDQLSYERPERGWEAERQLPAVNPANRTLDVSCARHSLLVPRSHRR